MTGKTALLPAMAFLLSGCGVWDYPPVEFTVVGDRIVATGVIDRSAIQSFRETVAESPNARTLVLQTIDGSVDDEANLELARMVRRAGFTTIVPSDGMVASGGTDLFLAGVDRILEEGACVGVHSWGDGFIDGSSLPRTSSSHRPYLEYYRLMEIPEEFYWFTLKSASASDIHWMDRSEADGFGITTNPSPRLGSSEECDYW